jgi:hypothetical protein
MTSAHSRRRFATATLLGPLLLAGCNSRARVSGNLTLTNAYGENTEVTVEITDRESGDRVLRDSYQVPASDDGMLVEDAVTISRSYDVEATVAETEESTSEVWRLPSDDGEDYYSIRVGVLSDGSVAIYR